MDWDQDGKLDIISGSYWLDESDGGFIQVLRGKGGLDFAKSETLLNENEAPLQNEPVVETDDPELDNTVNRICTQQHVVDYDNDGDLDMVVGCFGNSFYYYENIGDGSKNVISAEPVKLSVESPGGHAAPHLVDWDGDGDLDLLSGDVDGGVLMAENVGTRSEPHWIDFVTLIEPSAGESLIPRTEADYAPMTSTRVWASDWNDDGKLDLLVGDRTTVVTPREGVKRDDFESLLVDNNSIVVKLRERQSKLIERYESEMATDDGVSEETMTQLATLNAKMRAAYEARDEFANTESTGFVYLYLRN